MKKIILVLIILITLTACARVSNILERIELEDANCIIEREVNTHGGFLGDGEFFAKLSCTDLKESDLSSNWQKLPLNDEISKVMDMIMCDNKACSNSYERYQMPVNPEGYYYFVDRHSESTNKYDASDINNRSSYNFSLAMWDINNKMIYYYSLDT